LVILFNYYYFFFSIFDRTNGEIDIIRKEEQRKKDIELDDVVRGVRLDLVAVQFGELAQDCQRVVEPLAQDRLAALDGNVQQPVGGAEPLAVDVSHQVVAVAR